MSPRLSTLLLLLLLASCDKPKIQGVVPPAAEIIEIAITPELMKKPVPLTGYVPSEIPFATDAEFFAALDLSRPGLEKVKQAVESNDMDAAVAAFATYLRTRTSPVLVFEGEKVEPLGSPAATTKRLDANAPAEKVLARDYMIAGVRHKFEGPIQWDLNPTTQPGYKGAWSSQFHTQLNRMHFWVALAEAWRDTGNPVYLRDLTAQIEDWINRNPPPTLAQLPVFINRYRAAPGGRIQDFPLHLPLDSGQRTTNTTRVFEMIRRSPEVSDRTLVDIVKMIGSHARLLSQLQIEGNHLAIATGGLGMAAVIFPEFRESPAWLKEALTRVAVEMDKQVYPDGAQMELTPWYHFTALRQFANIIEGAVSNRYEVPPAVLGSLEKMFEYCVMIADPDGKAPPLNDSEYLNVAGVSKRALDFFPGREDFHFLAGDGKSGKPPAFTSLTVPFAGQAVMRSGWARDDLFLLMEYGPFGAGHQHEDKLGITVNAFGRRLLVDSARGKYEASVWRDYGVNASAHSTVLVDGLFQARRLAEKEINTVEAPVPVAWTSDDKFDYVCGAYGENENEVFALPTTPGGRVAPQHFQLVLDPKLGEDDVQIKARAIQRRHVLFVKPHYWIVADVLVPADDKPHEYTTLFQMGAGETSSYGQAVTLGKPGEAGMVLAAAPESASSLEIVRGQEKPFLLGWQFTDGNPSPIPAAVFRRTATGPVINAYAIVPHPAGTAPVAPQIEWLAPQNGSVTIRVTPGRDLPPVTWRIPREGGPAAVVAGDPASEPSAP